MKSIKNHVFIIFTLFSAGVAAQEFDCDVVINVRELDGTSFDYLQNSLQSEISNYINEYRWTEVDFAEKERIGCIFTIVIRKGDENFNFTAEAVIQSRRPIYNTFSETTTFIINDGSWVFNYPEGRSLIHDDLQFESLTGFIDYYSYLLLGYDFDSFSPFGGTEYFLKAQNIVDLAQNTESLGWNRTINNRRNRYVLVDDLLNSNYEPIRQAYYDYHRNALDIFVDRPDEARQQLVSTLNTILENKRRSTSIYIFDLFFDTKSKEIASILQDAESTLKQQAYTILTEVDAGHLSEYNALQN